MLKEWWSSPCGGRELFVFEPFIVEGGVVWYDVLDRHLNIFNLFALRAIKLNLLKCFGTPSPYRGMG